MKKQKSGSAQVPPTRSTGLESATGVALRSHEHEIPKGADRGSRTKIAGGAPKPDVDSPKPTGAQVEPARFTSNGQLPHNTVGTPTGSMPASALGLSVEDTQAKVDEANKSHDDFVAAKGRRQFLAPETVHRLPAVDIQAIAAQRGYVLPPGGARMTRSAFLDAQSKDEQIEKPKSSKSTKRSR